MDSVIGLDIGNDWIKAVEIVRNSIVKKIGKIKIYSEGELNEESREQFYIIKIKELFRSLKLSRDNVVTNFHGSYVLARTYLPPVTDKDSFEQWFVNNIEEIIPGTSIEDVIYAYELFPSGRALIAFARRREVERLLTVLRACNIFPLLIDASCLALYNAFAPHPWFKEKKNFAILDIANNSGDLMIVKEGEPITTGIINLKTKISNKDRESIRKYIEELGYNLIRIFNYYEKKENFSIKDLILTGDYAKVVGLRKNLKDLFGFTIEFGNPFVYQDFKMPKSHTDIESIGYAQALGLALKGLSKPSINLIPYEEKNTHKIFLFKKRIERSAKLSLIIAIPVLIILIVILFFGNYKNANLNRTLNDLKKKIVELSYVEEKESILNQKIKKIKELNRNRIKWSENLYHLGKDIPEGICLKKISTDIRLVSEGSNTARKIRIIIEGQSLSQERVIDLINNLEKRFKDIAVEDMKGELQCEFRISLGL
ncbi:MAG: hypothetical protein ABIL66_04720 [candidate division WOR-3 bacterium]